MEKALKKEQDAAKKRKKIVDDFLKGGVSTNFDAVFGNFGKAAAGGSKIPSAIGGLLGGGGGYALGKTLGGNKAIPLAALGLIGGGSVGGILGMSKSLDRRRRNEEYVRELEKALGVIR